MNPSDTLSVIAAKTAFYPDIRAILDGEIPFPAVVECSDEQYHASEHASSGMLRDLIEKSPWEVKNGPAKTVTDAMALGSAWHRLLLEYELYRDFYHFAPAGLVRNARNANYKQFLADRDISPAQAKERVLKESDWEQLVNGAATLAREPWFQRQLEGAAIEKCFFWTDKETGMACKAKPDILSDVMWDVKTAPSVDARTVYRKILDEYLAVQLVHYLEGRSMVFFGEPIDWTADNPVDIQAGWIFVRREAPAGEAVTRICDTDTLKDAAKLHRKLMRRLAYCKQSGDWFKLDSTPTVVTVPGSALTTYDDPVVIPF